ncbi:MAG: hypothetical protein V2I37_12240 [Marinilabiliaceae bacterium]|jgi:hypothetical protein|nr:hypothetical protein [Marinilabiliaceae bacterium]
MEHRDKRKQIIGTLQEKSVLKQIVFDNTNECFISLKKLLAAITREFNRELEGSDRRVRLVYKENGKFDVSLKVAGDILVFSMHSNVFEFDRNHPVWKTEYIQKDKNNSYSGIISIYNFLSDSFKYSRMDDLGYLIGRIFINREKQYFVEGKRQLGMLFSNYGNEELSREAIKRIVYTAMQYTLEFDLLVPPYDNVKIVSVGQLETKIQYSKAATGKRVGFQFNSDDVLEQE